ncbi:glucosyltransferase domain-containing protein [Clostridium sp. CT7]|uniref:glucosyltransferase domain-containing protein n=2 Tax=Clostridium TaxID=1485 RepID=UPI000825B219|nr:glucosyltransferase domain-containing protein [Clostridium sp. CT7]
MSFTVSVNKQIEDFKKFISKYKIPIIYSFIFSLICFGFMLTNHSLTIDEETWINGNNLGGIKLWLMQGRFGIFLLDKIISPSGTYVPFLWDFLSILIWHFSGVCFLYCISTIYPKFSKFSFFTFCAYFSSLPLVVGELLSYSMFNLQQSLGMLFMAISTFFIYNYFNTNKKKHIVASSIFLFTATSIYQSFSVIYIIVIVSYALIYILKSDCVNIKKIITKIIKSILAFWAGVSLYYIINKFITTYIAPDSGNYLSGYIGWDKGKSNIHVLLTTFHYIEKILLGDSAVYGGRVLLVITVLFSMYSIFSFINAKKAYNKFMICILSIMLLVCPFILSIILGTSGIDGRTYVSLPLAGAIELFLIINETSKIKIARQVVIIAVICILFLNSMYMNRLFYDSFVVYQYDTNIGNEIIHDIGTYGYDYKNTPIVFIGMHDINRKIISSSGSTGGSFFSWDDGNNVRITNFLKSKGYSVIMPATDQIKAAYNSSKGLQNWPNRNSIKKIQNCIIVKLSDPSQTWMSVNGVK